MSMERPSAPKHVQNPGRIGLTPTQSLPPPKEGQVCQPLMLSATKLVSVNVLVPSMPGTTHAHLSYVALMPIRQCFAVAPSKIYEVCKCI